jgi:hypothetical protein
MFNNDFNDDIQNHQNARKLQILKGFSEVQDILEKSKTRPAGEVHANGKWVWTQLPNGKFDWRNIKAKSDTKTSDTKTSDTKKSDTKKSDDKSHHQKMLQAQQEQYEEDNNIKVKNGVDDSKKNVTYKRVGNLGAGSSPSTVESQSKRGHIFSLPASEKKGDDHRVSFDSRAGSITTFVDDKGKEYHVSKGDLKKMSYFQPLTSSDDEEEVEEVEETKSSGSIKDWNSTPNALYGGNEVSRTVGKIRLSYNSKNLKLRANVGSNLATIGGNNGNFETEQELLDFVQDNKDELSKIKSMNSLIQKF